MKDQEIQRDSSLISFASLYGMSDYIAFALGIFEMKQYLTQTIFFSSSFWLQNVQIFTVRTNRISSTLFISTSSRESCYFWKSW